eukprot:3727031-Amphidinium_carterae.1
MESTATVQVYILFRTSISVSIWTYGGRLPFSIAECVRQTYEYSFEAKTIQTKILKPMLFQTAT